MSRLSWRGHAKVLAYLAVEEDAGPYFGPLENLLARMVDLVEIGAGRSKCTKKPPQARSAAL
jgi:hypothetical protein